MSAHRSVWIKFNTAFDFRFNFLRNGSLDIFPYKQGSQNNFIEQLRTLMSVAPDPE